MKSCTVIIKVTDRCNLNCRYCSYPSLAVKDLSIDVLAKFLDGFSLYAKKWDIDRVKFLFHGGEPFLWHIDNYKKAFDMIYEKLSDNMQIGFTLQTNGTILSKPHLSLFQDKNVSIGLSLDGTETIHNKMRPFKNGEGSFNAVYNFLKELKSREKRFGIVCVVTKEILEHIEDAYLSLTKFSSNIRFSPVAPIGRGAQFNLDKGEFGDFLIELFKLHVKNSINRKQAVKIEPIDTMLSLALGLPKKERECTFSDSCGDFITLNVDGNIYNCGRLVGKDEFMLGNVEENKWIEKDFSDFFKERVENLKNGPCKSCKYFEFCYGGCPATAIGNPKENKTIFCLDYKKFFDYITKEGLELIRPLLIEELKDVKLMLTLLDEIQKW